MSETVKLLKEVYEALAEIAKKQGKSIEEIIMDSVEKRLNPKTRIEIYKKLYEKHFREAEEFYAKGDILQSGEKYWGALASLLSAIAAKENLPHYTHRDFREIIELLTDRTGDPEYSKLFSSAEALRANFYHNFMGKLSFEAHREDAVKLARKLTEYVAGPT